MADNRYAAVMGALANSERVHLVLRPAWRSFWGGFSLSFCIMALLMSCDTTAAVLAGAVSGAVILIMRYRSLFTVTSKRVIVRTGIIANNTTEVEIRHSRELRVRQGIIQRMLCFGDIEISTAAGTGPEVILKGIVKPHDLKEAIRHVRNGLS